MITEYDFEQCKPLMVEVINLLRSRNLSYDTADFVLVGAQKLLKQVAKCELSELPLADGIDYDCHPSRIKLSSRLNGGV